MINTIGRRKTRSLPTHAHTSNSAEKKTTINSKTHATHLQTQNMPHSRSRRGAPDWMLSYVSVVRYACFGASARRADFLHFLSITRLEISIPWMGLEMCARCRHVGCSVFGRCSAVYACVRTCCRHRCLVVVYICVCVCGRLGRLVG